MNHLHAPRTPPRLTDAPRLSDSMGQRGLVCPEPLATYRAFLVYGHESEEEALASLVARYCEDPRRAGQESFLLAFLRKGYARPAGRATAVPPRTAQRWAQAFEQWAVRHLQHRAKVQAARQEERERREQERQRFLRAKEAAQVACSESCGKSPGKHKKIVKAWPKFKAANGRWQYVPILDGRCPDCPMREFEPDRGKELPR